VDIETDDLELLRPVAKRRFNEARTVSPPALEIDPSGSSQRYITGWKITGTSGMKTVFAQQGEGNPRVVTQQLSTTAADLMDADKPLVVSMELQGIRGVKSFASDSLMLVRDTLSTELERLTLTLFGISSDKVTPIAEEQIKEFVRNVPRGSTVIVRGYADMLGNADFNKKLSQRRANAVCTTIRKHLKKRIDLQCTDIATDRFPPGIDSYETPEERMLSRTVQIEIKKQR
jgi:outer membrane protein OmpA-like peptidoglycan-associated protein